MMLVKKIVRFYSRRRGENRPGKIVSSGLTKRMPECYDRPQQNKNALIRGNLFSGLLRKSMCHRLKAHAAKVGKGTAFEQQPIAESFLEIVYCLRLAGWLRYGPNEEVSRRWGALNPGWNRGLSRNFKLRCLPQNLLGQAFSMPNPAERMAEAMVKIDLKGQVKEFESGITPAQVAKSIGMGLYKSACAARIDGKTCDLRTPITEDCALEILTFEIEDGKKAYWHTTSHILAQAVQRLYPGTKFAIGPSVDTGFYYDFDLRFSHLHGGFAEA